MRPTTPKAALKAANTSAFLVTNSTNVRYLTGLSLSSGSVLITSTAMTVFTDSRYIEMAQKKAKKPLQVRNMSELEKAMAKMKECGCESGSLTLDQLRRMKRKYKNTKFVQKSEIIEEFRRSKNDDELRHFRKSQKITKEIIRRVPTLLRRAITEKQLAWQLEIWAHELGADDMSFEPIVAFGTHTSSPHHKPTTRKLQKGHIVQIDVGVKVNGYCSDQSEVFFTKKPTAIQELTYNTLLQAKDAAIAAITPGITNHKLDRIAREVLAQEGLEEYFTHALGHGVGLDIHEGVTLSSRGTRVPLLKNEIVTIEPGVYFPGKFGMRVEEEVIV